MVICVMCNEYFENAYGLTEENDKIICHTCGMELDNEEFDDD